MTGYVKRLVKTIHGSQQFPARGRVRGRLTYVINISLSERPLDERTERKQPDRALHPRPAPASPASTTPRRALSTRAHHRSINDRARARRSSRRRRRHRLCASVITNHPRSDVCPRPRVFTSRASASTVARRTIRASTPTGGSPSRGGVGTHALLRWQNES